jgi:hypothetical protein
MQDKKDFNSTNGSKGKTQELIKKNNRAEERDFIFSKTIQTGSGANSDSSSMRTAFFHGVKRPGRDVDNLHLVLRL